MSTRAQLKALSDATFPDNNTGSIIPSEHRAFNEAMLPMLAPGFSCVVSTQQEFEDWLNGTQPDAMELLSIPVGYNMRGKTIVFGRRDLGLPARAPQSTVMAGSLVFYRPDQPDRPFSIGIQIQPNVNVSKVTYEDDGNGEWEGYLYDYYAGGWLTDRITVPDDADYIVSQNTLLTAAQVGNGYWGFDYASMVDNVVDYTSVFINDGTYTFENRVITIPGVTKRVSGGAATNLVFTGVGDTPAGLRHEQCVFERLNFDVTYNYGDDGSGGEVVVYSAFISVANGGEFHKCQFNRKFGNAYEFPGTYIIGGETGEYGRGYLPQGQTILFDGCYLRTDASGNGSEDGGGIMIYDVGGKFTMRNCKLVSKGGGADYQTPWVFHALPTGSDYAAGFNHYGQLIIQQCQFIEEKLSVSDKLVISGPMQVAIRDITIEGYFPADDHYGIVCVANNAAQTPHGIIENVELIGKGTASTNKCVVRGTNAWGIVWRKIICKGNWSDSMMGEDGHGMQGCFNVERCMIPIYYQCYSGGNNNSTYAAAFTLNGGWNQQGGS